MYSDVPCGAGPSVEAVGEVRTLPDPVAAPSALVVPASSTGEAEGTEMPAPDGGGGGEVRTCRSVALMVGGKIRRYAGHKMCLIRFHDFGHWVSLTCHHIMVASGVASALCWPRRPGWGGGVFIVCWLLLRLFGGMQ